MRSFRIVAEPVSQVEDLLAAEGFGFEAEPFFPSACRQLTAEPKPLGESLAARFGLIYIQDRSSMLAPLALREALQRLPGPRVLDMCASPGGKSGFLAGLTPGGMVLANEPSKDRLATLRANLRRLNCVNAATCGYDGALLPLAPNSLDAMLLDPPCSGWGTVDKHPKVATLWAEDKVAPLTALQRNLLRAAQRLLKPGGTLVYSTCTTNVDENEAQVRFALEELGLEFEPLQAVDGFVFHEPELGLDGVLRVDGPASGAQGHFVARLRKPGNPQEPEPRPGGLPGREMSAGELNADCLDVKQLSDGKIFDFSGKVVHVPRGALDFPRELRFQGFVLGKMAKNGRFQPWPGLRLLRKPAGGDLNLDSVQPLHDLLSGRGVPASKGSGWAGLYYKGLPLALLSRKAGRYLLGRV